MSRVGPCGRLAPQGSLLAQSASFASHARQSLSFCRFTEDDTRTTSPRTPGRALRRTTLSSEILSEMVSALLHQCCC